MKERYLIFLDPTKIVIDELKEKYEIFFSYYMTYSYIQKVFSEEEAFYFKLKYNNVVKEVLTTEQALNKYGTIAYSS